MIDKKSRKVDSLIEQPFFFLSEGKSLFGFLHLPAQGNEVGVVVCPPSFEEKLHAHRVLVEFSRLLSRKGFTVMRFDYYGEGDSEGKFSDADVQTRISDIVGAVQELRARGIQKIGLLGLRFGGTLAALVTENHLGIDFLILWSPIVDLHLYFDQLLRANLTSQLAMYKRIKIDRGQLKENLLAGENVNVEGWILSSRFYRDAVKINLLRNSGNPKCPVLIVDISGRPVSSNNSLKELYQSYINIGARCKLMDIKETNFWNNMKFYVPYCGALFKETTAWLRNIIGSQEWRSQ